MSDTPVRRAARPAAAEQDEPVCPAALTGIRLQELEHLSPVRA
ncbi:hypothetical protein [Streptomyces badius]|nr:hypothetical protein [Streptomyces badius]